MDSEGKTALRQVGKEMVGLGDSTASLIKRVQDLEDRLGQVLLSPTEPIQDAKQAQPEEQKVVLAVQLDALNYRIQEVDRSISSLMDRLEL